MTEGTGRPDFSPRCLPVGSRHPFRWVRAIPLADIGGTLSVTATVEASWLQKNHSFFRAGVTLPLIRNSLVRRHPL